MSSDPVSVSQAAYQSATSATTDSVADATTATVHTMSSIHLIGIDYLIIAVVLVSVGVSIWRGFAKEALSLLVWILAVWVALSFAGDLAQIFAAKLPDPQTRYYMSFAILMAITLMVGGLVNLLLHSMVKKTGLTGIDRLLGLFFGVARGTLIVAIILLCATFTSLPDEGWWNSSFFIPHFAVMTHWLQGFIPSNVIG